ncbi:hypothetical protein IC582_007920 [Cucumis melo]
MVMDIGSSVFGCVGYWNGCGYVVYWCLLIVSGVLAWTNRGSWSQGNSALLFSSIFQKVFC